MRVAAVITAASLTLAAAVSVTACSPKSTAAASGSTPTAVSATSASAAARATSAAAAGGLRLVGERDELQRVQGAVGRGGVADHRHHVHHGESPDSVAGQIFGCEYDGANAALLQITVAPHHADGKYLIRAPTCPR